MTIKKVTLKNIKRSYRRLEDLCMHNDLGWYFGQRDDAICIVRECDSVKEIFSYGVNLFAYMSFNDFEEKDLKRAENWLHRWCKRIGLKESALADLIQEERNNF